MHKLIATVALTALPVMLAACGSSTPAKPAASKTFTVSGHLTLTSANVDSEYGEGCFGTNGFDDLESGAQVVVKDASGKSIALGQLGPGTKSGGGVVCTFPFMVSNVPSLGGVYAIEVGHRGGVSFTQATASDVELSIS